MVPHSHHNSASDNLAEFAEDSLLDQWHALCDCFQCVQHAILKTDLPHRTYSILINLTRTYSIFYKDEILSDLRNGVCVVCCQKSEVL